MSQLMNAVFEAGVFRPTSEPPFSEGQQVEILVRPRNLMAPQAVAAALASAAWLPVQAPGDAATSQNHDRVLYDEAQSS